MFYTAQAQECYIPFGFKNGINFVIIYLPQIPTTYGE